jgi:hypothetical protein
VGLALSGLRKAGLPHRIQQSITVHLRAGSLVLFTGKKVGLPAWKKRGEEATGN